MEVFHELHSEEIKANTRKLRARRHGGLHLPKRGRRRFILCVLLHAADIGNPVKPLVTYRAGESRAERVFRAGRPEGKGMPVSAMMDAAVTNAVMSQINFMEFAVLCTPTSRGCSPRRASSSASSRTACTSARARARAGRRESLELVSARAPASNASPPPSDSSPSRARAPRRSARQVLGGARGGQARDAARFQGSGGETRLQSETFYKKSASASASFDSDRDVTSEGNDFAERAAFEALMREAPQNAKLALAAVAARRRIARRALGFRTRRDGF